MEETNANKRPNQIVSDSESMSDQPVLKSARREEEQSSNVLPKEESNDELEKSLLELSAQMDDSRRKTEEAGLESARRINSLIEKVRARRSTEDDIVKDLNRENAALKKKFASAKRDEKIAKKMNFMLAAKNFTLKEDLDGAKIREEEAKAMKDRLAQENESLKLEIDELRRSEEDANVIKKEISDEYSALKCELDESIHINGDLSNEISALREELENMRVKAEEDRLNGAKIVDLTLKLAQSEQQSVKVAEYLLSMQHGLKRVMRSGASPKVDIFQFCCPNTDHNSISIGEAQSQLRSKLNECGNDSYQRYCRDNGTVINLKCSFCRTTIKNKIIDHFLSAEHADKVKMVGATVSLPAVQHWLQHLQQAIEWKEEDRKDKKRDIEKLLEQRCG